MEEQRQRKQKTTTQRILSLLRHFKLSPEQDITPDSPARDFFNVTTKMKDGAPAGVLLFRVPSGKHIQLFIELKDDMTHDDVFLSMTTAISLADAIANGFPVVSSDTNIVSCYDRVIQKLLWQLKYAHRRLRKAQKKFHDAEGRYHRALNTPSYVLRCARGSELHALQKRADECQMVFCDAFRLRQELVDRLQDIIHQDAEGKEKLASLDSNSTKH